MNKPKVFIDPKQLGSAAAADAAAHALAAIFPDYKLAVGPDALNDLKPNQDAVAAVRKVLEEQYNVPKRQPKPEAV